MKEPSWELATFRAADGLTHYLHIIESSNVGSNRMFLHCSRRRQLEKSKASEPKNVIRPDVQVTCLWCLTDQEQY